MSLISLRGCCAAATIVASIPPSALAQSDVRLAEDGERSSQNDEIVVKGSKRDTELIDSDLSVTVLDKNAIEDARLRDFRRIDDLVPNVQFNESGQRGSIFITVRGVESNPFIINRAAVYIDGIPFRELSNSVLNQIESIEVLRGPQGTLYGANTESGLIIVTTNTPSDELTGNLRLTGIHFPSGEGIEADGSIGGPLINGVLAGSLSFNITREDAYVENLGTSTGDTGHIKETFIQGRLRWTPTDRLTVNTTAYWLDLDAPGLFDQQYVPLDLDLYNTLYADFFNGGLRADDWTVYEDAPKRTTEEEIVFGLSASYELDYGNIDIAASYRELEEDARGLDFDQTATPVVSGLEAEKEEFTNVEIRFTSPAGTVFDYILGASYYEDSEERTLASFVGPGDINSYIFAPAQRAESKDISVFGTANFYVLPKLRLSAGVRYDRAKRSTIQRAGELDLGFGSVIVYPDADLSETFEEWLPRFSAHYKVNDNFSVHATSARGYIPGGFNLAAVQQGFFEDDIISYDSETLWSHEIGFKWRSEDRRLRASGAIFHITSDNWQEIQIATDSTGRPVSSDFIGSDASIRSRGFEFEAQWQAADVLSVDGHIGYADAEYKDLQLDGALNVRGQAVQFVPEYDAGVAVRYESPLGLFVRAEASFIGEMPLRARGDALQEAVTTLGLQIGFEAEHYALRVFGENLTNERRASGLAIENLAFGTDGLFYAPLDAPRIVGAELEARF